MTDEEYVRAHWVSLVARTTDDYRGPYDLKLFRDAEPIVGRTRAIVWALAAEFTSNRLEQIRQIEEEIREAEHKLKQQSVCGVSMSGPTPKEQIWKRILAREQAALAELKRGML